MALDSDPYVVLGVPRDADDAEIARAWRLLRRECHPDVNSAPGAAARFGELEQAYEMLSDPVIRAEYDRASAGPGAAAAKRRRWDGVRGLSIFFLVIAACVGSGAGLAYLTHPGGGAATVSATTPPVQPTAVPQAQGPPVDVKPAFTVSRQASDTALRLAAGVAGPPVRQGFEILVPLAPPAPGADIGDICVVVTVPETNDVSSAEAGAAGETFNEYALDAVDAGGKTELAFPGVLPGSYVLYPQCALHPSGTPLPLGSVTTRNVGVADGYPYAVPGNAMVVFAVRASAGTTTVTFGAIGGPHGSLVASLIPPADDACIDSDYTTSQHTYWQPVKALVSQQVTGSAEWLETGTLVFRGSAAVTPRGIFYYDCAEDTTQWEPGFGLGLP